jgi:hypothetical protein
MVARNPVPQCWTAHVGEEPQATALVVVWNLQNRGPPNSFGVEPGKPRAAMVARNPVPQCWAARVVEEPQAAALVVVWNLPNRGPPNSLGVEPGLGRRIYGVEPFAVGIGPVRPFNSAAARGFG